MRKPQAKTEQSGIFIRMHFGPEGLDRVAVRWMQAWGVCSLLTLQFVPDIVGPFLDLSRELL